MDSTATIATIARRDAYEGVCDGNTFFWKCTRLPFVGCCSHDPCHDGYCHDLSSEVLEHMSIQGLRRRAQSTTTITYTLIHLAQTTKVTPATSLASSLNSKLTISLPTGISTTPNSAAVANAVLPNPALASIRGSTLVLTPSTSTPKPQTGFKPNTSLYPSRTASSRSTTQFNLLASPVAGSKKSKRSIAGIAVGVIAASILILLLTYLGLSRKRRAKNTAATSRRIKRRKDSRAVENVVDIVTVKDDTTTPMTPGGAKLEAQRGAMLNDGQRTGFRALGMTAAGSLTEKWEDEGRGRRRQSEREWDRQHVPSLQMPVPMATKGNMNTNVNSNERPASHLGMGMSAFAAGLIHPAYRQSAGNDASTTSARFYGAELEQLANEKQEQEGGHDAQTQVPDSSAVLPRDGLAISSDERNLRTVSWAPGVDVIDIIALGTVSEKPRFNDVTSKWSVIGISDGSSSGKVSSWGIGKAVSTLNEPSVGEDADNVAISTENEITSPVEDGGLRRPVRRNTFKGFEELVSGDGRLR